MIPTFVEATLHWLFAVTMTDKLPILRIAHGSGQVTAMPPLLLFAIPRLELIKDRSQCLAADDFIEISVHPMTLLEELQARILAKIGFATESRTMAAHIQAVMSTQVEDQTFSLSKSAPDPRRTEPNSSVTEGE